MGRIAGIIALLLASSAVAGTLHGKVTDKATGEGYPAVSIVVTGAASQSLAADLDGTYTLTLAPGTYTIEFSTPDYIPETRTVTITGDEAKTLDLVIAPIPAKVEEETIEVYNTIDTHKESAVLAERRASATVSDGVSSEQIQRSPDSNASDAAKRMVAATIQDNRYVVIRGLGGRYSLTLLNGILLPSPDPDVPAAPLDLFPASMITNLTVQKTFSPDLPGNFAGGALSIETRNYPSSFTFKAKVGLANDSQSSFRGVNTYQGGSLDLLGYDDGTRSLPGSIPDDKLAGDPSLPQEQRAQQAAAFHNIWTLHPSTAAPNMNLAATVGDSLKIRGERVGYYASASYGHGYGRRITHIARVGEPDGNGGYLPSVMQLDDTMGIAQANLGGVVAGGWKGERSTIDAFTLYTHTADSTASEVIGTDNSTATVDRTRLRFLERELAFAQVVGEHKVASRAKLSWQANVAHVAQHEPDTRDLLRTLTPDGRYAIDHGSGSAERLFADLGDTTGGGGAKLQLPFETLSKFELGASLVRSSRTYQARRFHFDITGDSAFLPPDQAFSPDNAGFGMSMYEATLPTDGYVATRTIGSAYALADLAPTPKLRVVGGARFERSDLDVGLDSKIDLMAPPTPHTTRGDTDALPAVNVVYALTPSMNVRAAYALTVARPNFREIAPALYYDYVRRRAIGGNPNLTETTIHNADLRWETFLGDNEVLAASLFSKRFIRPIEQTVEDAGDGQNVGFSNATSAQTYGVELEARLSLGRFARTLSPFTVGGNLSLIRSRIDLMGVNRALQGQSPYVANIDLGYEREKSGTRIDVLYNAFGRRIEEVGTGGAGNVYEEPVHRLDLAVSQQLPRQMKLKLAGSNLLGERAVRTQNGVEIFAYRIGVTVVGSVELSLQ